MAFLTSKSATEKITTLESRVSELEADATSREEHIAGLEQTVTDRDDAITALQGLLTDREGQIETLTAERDKATADFASAQASLTEATGKLEGFDAKVETAALAKFQSLGGDPVPASGKHDDPKPGAELTGLAKAIAIHKAGKQAKK